MTLGRHVDFESIMVTNPPSSEVKVKTCKLFHFYLKGEKTYLQNFCVNI